MGSEGKSSCKLRTSMRRDCSMSRTTASGLFLATCSRTSSPVRVKGTAWKCKESLPARDCATLGSVSKTTTLKPIDPPDFDTVRNGGLGLRGRVRNHYSTDIQIKLRIGKGASCFFLGLGLFSSPFTALFL